MPDYRCRGCRKEHTWCCLNFWVFNYFFIFIQLMVIRDMLIFIVGLMTRIKDLLAMLLNRVPDFPSLYLDLIQNRRLLILRVVFFFTMSHCIQNLKKKIREDGINILKLA